MKRKKILYVVVPVLIIILGIVGFFVYRGNRSTYRDYSSVDIPLIQHIGIELGEYNPATQLAGDIVFTDNEMGQLDLPVIDFGYVIPANSAGPEKTNPQPTFVVPLGTKVHSLIDGVVVKVEQIYSGDYTIHVAKGRFSFYVYETEHVINPMVSVGDKVQAGQPIAEVSDYDVPNQSGNGILEIGILVTGNPPAHLCPFDYLDPSIRDDTLSQLRSIYQSWNEFRGEEAYDISMEVPGCVTTDPVYEIR